MRKLTFLEVEELFNSLAEIQFILEELFEDEVKHLQDQLDLFEMRESKPDESKTPKLGKSSLRLLQPDFENQIKD